MYPESLKAILKLLPESARLEVVKQKNQRGASVLSQAASKPESLKAILELLPETDRLDAVKQKNLTGDSVLHYAAWAPELLKTILELLPISERLDAVKQTDQYGRSVLNYVDQEAESRKAILELLPKDQMSEAGAQILKGAGNGDAHIANHNVLSSCMRPLYVFKATCLFVGILTGLISCRKFIRTENITDILESAKPVLANLLEQGSSSSGQDTIQIDRLDSFSHCEDRGSMGDSLHRSGPKLGR